MLNLPNKTNQLFELTLKSEFGKFRRNKHITRPEAKKYLSAEVKEIKSLHLN